MENENSPEKSPYDSLENSEEVTTPDPNFIDNVRTPFDADLSLHYLLKNRDKYQESQRIKKKPQLAKILPPMSPLDATSSQNRNFSQPRLTGRLRRQPVKDYRIYIPLSKLNSIASNENTFEIELKQNSTT